MFEWVTVEGRKRRQVAANIYGAVVSQSRQSTFYEHGAIADTVDGRFELIALHGSLIIGRLCADDMEPQGTKMAQAYFDAMFRNLEWSLREIGIGDLSVPRHVKRMMAAFKGRSYAYNEAVKGGRGSMIHALRRNAYATNNPQPDNAILERMAAYIDDVVYALGQTSLADIESGNLNFPEPHSYFAGVLHEQKVA